MPREKPRLGDLRRGIYSRSERVKFGYFVMTTMKINNLFLFCFAGRRMRGNKE
jgi:hypothetical protein